MKLVRTNAFKDGYRNLPRHAQVKFENKFRLFKQNIHHSSLWVKKMRGHKNRWEASIDMFYRFTFEIHSDHYLLRRIGPHDDILKSRSIRFLRYHAATHQIPPPGISLD